MKRKAITCCVYLFVTNAKQPITNKFLFVPFWNISKTPQTSTENEFLDKNPYALKEKKTFYHFLQKHFYVKWFFVRFCTLLGSSKRFWSLNDISKIPQKSRNSFVIRCFTHLMYFLFSSKGTLFGCMHCSRTSWRPGSIFNQCFEWRPCICGKFKWTHRQSKSLCRFYLQILYH